MLEEISSSELTEWVAYDGIEPFGQHRADLHAALIACVLANIHRDPKKGEPYKIQDFVLLPPEPKAPQTPDSLLAMAELITKAYGGQDLRKQTPLLYGPDGRPMTT